MKHNPRLNEKVARMPGFADAHPLQPQETVQGAYAVIHELAEWLIALTGMHSVAMSTTAGAHGAPCGSLCHQAPHAARGTVSCIIRVTEMHPGPKHATQASPAFAVETSPQPHHNPDNPPPRRTPDHAATAFD